MKSKIVSVDAYLISGCGRCEYWDTPQCKVHSWTQELILLRKIVLDCGLNEEIKWSMPCYTYNGNIVCMIAAFKEYAALSFFKGSLLKDKKKLLQAPGENSQAARLFKFTSMQDIKKIEANIKEYIQEAILLEDQGSKVVFKKELDPIPEELENMFLKNSKLKTAFYELTPGKQRGYILFFTQPKQSETRTTRIKKCIPMILQGKGMHDDYKMKGKN